jgi:DNA-binding response OmpR family regulator
MTIEDQPAMLEHLKQALEEHGAEVIALSSAQTAMALLTAQPASVQLVISDLGLPELDGYQFIRAVRTQLGLSARELPAIALSAFAREDDRVRSTIHGYQAHMTKPYQVSQLIAAARSLLVEVGRPS